jgi:hypothetical protein
MPCIRAYYVVASKPADDVSATWVLNDRARFDYRRLAPFGLGTQMQEVGPQRQCLWGGGQRPPITKEAKSLSLIEDHAR